MSANVFKAYLNQLPRFFYVKGYGSMIFIVLEVDQVCVDDGVLDVFVSKQVQDAHA